MYDSTCVKLPSKGQRESMRSTNFCAATAQSRLLSHQLVVLDLAINDISPQTCLPYPWKVHFFIRGIRRNFERYSVESSEAISGSVLVAYRLVSRTIAIPYYPPASASPHNSLILHYSYKINASRSPLLSDVVTLWLPYTAGDRATQVLHRGGHECSQLTQLTARGKYVESVVTC